MDIAPVPGWVSVTIWHLVSVLELLQGYRVAIVRDCLAGTGLTGSHIYTLAFTDASRPPFRNG